MTKNVKRALGVTAGITLVIAGAYGWLVMRYAMPPPKPSRNFTDILNEPVLRIDAEQRAWRHYRQALLEMAVNPPQLWIDDPRAVIELIEADKQEGGGGERKASEIKTLIEYVRRQGPRMSAIRRASEFPSLGFTLSDQWTPADRELVFRHIPEPKRAQLIAADAALSPRRNPPLWSVKYPAREIMDIAKMLHAQAALAARDGNGRATADDIVALFGLATQMREIPGLIHDVVAASVTREAIIAWSNAMYRNPNLFSRDDLLSLERIARATCNQTLAVRIDSQRTWLLDALQRNYTGAEDGYAYVPELIGGRLEKSDDDLVPEVPAATRMRWASRREIVDRYDRLLALAGPATAKPFWERDWKAYDAERNRLRDDARYWPAHYCSVDAEQYHAQREETLQLLDATILVSAATRYRLETGDWPGSAQELVTLYLPAVPPDRFTGKPLGYRYDRERPVIYSIGADGKDDAGRAATVTSYDSKESVSQPWHGEFHSRIMRPDGDLILWPIAAPKVQVITTKK